MKNGRYEEAGRTKWYLNDQLHREDGPAVEYVHCYKGWFINGQHHREDGPAIEHANGPKEWYLNGLLHREDGPAIEYSNGDKEWWINDIELSEEEFNQWLMKKKLNYKLNEQLKPKPTQKRSKI
ncbi:hypothetical protein [Janthinobacterium sp. RB2P8]|uniref:hypothetical protein n=1 Tax=Janthinobacterium sp. RB2P8 TaxID=3424191 RepID=UPI003F28319A